MAVREAWLGVGGTSLPLSCCGAAGALVVLALGGGAVGDTVKRCPAAGGLGGSTR